MPKSSVHFIQAPILNFSCAIIDARHQNYVGYVCLQVKDKEISSVNFVNSRFSSDVTGNQRAQYWCPLMRLYQTGAVALDDKLKRARHATA